MYVYINISLFLCIHGGKLWLNFSDKSTFLSWSHDPVSSSSSTGNSWNVPSALLTPEFDKMQNSGWLNPCYCLWVWPFTQFHMGLTSNQRRKTTILQLDHNIGKNLRAQSDWPAIPVSWPAIPVLFRCHGAFFGYKKGNMPFSAIGLLMTTEQSQCQ